MLLKWLKITGLSLIIWNLCYSAESQTSAEILRQRSCRVESDLS